MVLDELGLTCRDANENEEAKQHLTASLQMKRSLYGDVDHPEIAWTLCFLGALSRHVRNLDPAREHLEESLRMSRALHGNVPHPDIAATLYELGLVSRDGAEFAKAEQQLEESLQMKRCFYYKHHPELAFHLCQLKSTRKRAHDARPIYSSRQGGG